MSEEVKTNFIRNIIDADLAENKNDGKVITRFPPEPNGFLHVGHSKSICLNFGLAQSYDRGHCLLRFDDTNPISEEEAYIKAIEKDVAWLGFDWSKHLTHASDYFDKLYETAIQLIKDGKAYVCSLTVEEFQNYRGDFNTPGKESPERERSVEENLKLFERMRDGEFADGSHTLRAKIDMQSPNMNMRDPALYRIRKATHPRAGDKWCIYPMYDFAHPLCDAFEYITHSVCTLEFQDHRPLYEWLIDNCDVPSHPRQIEFSRLNLDYTITSKRKLKQLVEDNHVDGWDDPRMPTLAGMRRRGVPPKAIRDFCDELGVSKQDSVLELNLLDEAIRDELNTTTARRMAVLDPIKVVIDNYPEDQVEELEASNHPQVPEMGKRKIPFCNTVYIDSSDFMEEPEKKFFRLAPGKDVRLLNAYVITCNEVIKEGDKIVELRCTYAPETKGGKKPADGHKVKGTIQWVSAKHAIDAEVRLYDRLFKVENPKACEDLKDSLNPDSLSVLTNAKLEPSLLDAKPGECFQFNRVGYFCVDTKDSAPQKPIFNKTIGLRQTWNK